LKKKIGVSLRWIYLILMNVITIPLVLFWTFSGIALFPIAYLYMKIIMGKDTGSITRKCVWIYGRVWHFLLCFFVSFKKTGLEKEKFDQPSIIVVNHRSFFDTYCMNMFPVYDIYFAIRAWPFKIFFFSFFMSLAKYLDIESTPWDKIRNPQE